MDYEKDRQQRDRYDAALYLLSEVLNCGTSDAEIILDMMRVHNEDGELVDLTKEYIDDVGISWSFGAFVTGVEHVVLSTIRDRISGNLYDGLSTVTIDDNYVAWGGVASKGDVSLETAEIFAEMCKEGVTDERVEQLIMEEESTD